MAFSKYLAFDFGAESGRAIVGILEHDQLRLEEVHRFPNHMVSVHDHLYWDFLHLFHELKNGLRLAVKAGHGDVRSIAIDTWGVDFGLIDKNGLLLGNPVSYRDLRTNTVMDRVFDVIPREELYRLTGIQFLQFNTLYQLYSLRLQEDTQLNITNKLLFIPDLFNYVLTGVMATEETIASTSQLMDPHHKTWREELFNRLDLPITVMPHINKSGSRLGMLSEKITQETGMPRVQVVSAAGHDTACAVAAVPAVHDNWAYLSSGTWSLIGIEQNSPAITDRTLNFGFTNESGFGGTKRILKNIMGMWLLERSRDAWQAEGKCTGYNELLGAAETAEPFKSLIDPDDQRFLNPVNMVEAIRSFCKDTKQKAPADPGQVVRCILESLALKYAWVIKRINQLGNNPVSVLHVVGGGSKNDLLNGFIANATGIKVIAGPEEGTAIGNILIQAITMGDVRDLKQARQIIHTSFHLKTFSPEHSPAWTLQLKRFRQIINP